MGVTYLTDTCEKLLGGPCLNTGFIIIFNVNPFFLKIDIFDTDRMSILILGKLCGKNVEERLGTQFHKLWYSYF